jgi:hypothetical protein
LKIEAAAPSLLVVHEWWPTRGLQVNAKEVASTAGDPPKFAFIVRSNGQIEQ